MTKVSQFQLRMTEQQKKTLEQMARSQRESMSEFVIRSIRIRRAIMCGEKVLKDPEPPPRSEPEKYMWYEPVEGWGA